VLVSGFTVIRNARLMGYPIVESITSILPIVDEFIVGVGQSDDDTRQMVASIGSPKVTIFDSFWEPSDTSGLILSEKTNEALDRCRGDWAFYLQGDEIVHERDFDVIVRSLERDRTDDRVEGLLFDYLHFYGSYDVVATARNWYRREVRVVKKQRGVRSFGGAQGFRAGDRKPRVRPSGGAIYHYGWAKPPRLMGTKNKLMNRWWHGEKYDKAFDDYAYKRGYGLRRFVGSHPAVMHDLVASQNWVFSPTPRLADWNLKDYKNLLSDVAERATGRRFGERRNYEVLEPAYDGDR
jgi:glycosyltransferase involved in cell wall biosynthesis